MEENKMSMMDKMMDFMMGRMSKEEKEEMMNKMMDKFFADFTPEDKQKMMGEMMPKMMEGVNMMDMMPKMMMNMMGRGEGESGMMGMMSRMMGGSEKNKTTAMPHMMTEMMPRCLEMMLPTIPKDKRVKFVMEMVAILMAQGCAGMSDEEKKDFMTKIGEKVKVQ
jgi:hypothetical protein